MAWNEKTSRKHYEDIGVNMYLQYSVLKWMQTQGEKKGRPKDYCLDQWKLSCVKEIQRSCSKS